MNAVGPNEGASASMNDIPYDHSIPKLLYHRENGGGPFGMEGP